MSGLRGWERAPSDSKGPLWRSLNQELGDDECWPWLGAANPTGYGVSRIDGKSSPAHRVVYQLLVGPIPTGYDVDHVCHSRDLSCRKTTDCPHRACVNPRHLEAVTRAENLRRSKARITHCPQGHEYTPENTGLTRGGQRSCIPCRRARDIARNRALGMQPRRADFATHCVNGHRYTVQTLHVEPATGVRSCRVCGRERALAKRRARREAQYTVPCLHRGCRETFFSPQGRGRHSVAVHGVRLGRTA